MKIQLSEPMHIPTVTHNDLVARRGASGKAFITKSERLKDAEATWAAHLAKYTPARPLRGALTVRVRFLFAGGTLAPKITKPDLDNLAKTLLDVLGRLGWYATGDQQICSLALTKIKGAPVEGVELTIEEVSS